MLKMDKPLDIQPFMNRFPPPPLYVPSMRKQGIFPQTRGIIQNQTLKSKVQLIPEGRYCVHMCTYSQIL